MHWSRRASSGIHVSIQGIKWELRSWVHFQWILILWFSPDTTDLLSLLPWGLQDWLHRSFITVCLTQHTTMGGSVVSSWLTLVPCSSFLTFFLLLSGSHVQGQPAPLHPNSSHLRWGLTNKTWGQCHQSSRLCLLNSGGHLHSPHVDGLTDTVSYSNMNVIIRQKLSFLCVFLSKFISCDLLIFLKGK